MGNKKVSKKTARNNNVVQSSNDVVSTDMVIPEITSELLNNLCRENSQLILDSQYGMKIIETYDTAFPSVFCRNYLRLIGGSEMFDFLLEKFKSTGMAFDVYQNNLEKYVSLCEDKKAASGYMDMIIAGISVYLAKNLFYPDRSLRKYMKWGTTVHQETPLP